MYFIELKIIIILFNTYQGKRHKEAKNSLSL